MVLRQNIRDFIVVHPNVIGSSDKNYVIRFFKQGKLNKVSLHKTLLQIPGSKLYQDMIQPEQNGGLSDVSYEDGNSIVSDTFIRFIIPINIRRMTECQKVTCGCERYISTIILHELFLSWGQKRIDITKQEWN